uniref:Reverse transcriptase domain-containing protein n=1 Tax=Tanacetum cinerariifolium TaxID=118510 RepID=A0A6L2MNL9_TANCI|nr:hypothetical protein [Tanacetum cinerariifolium]
MKSIQTFLEEFNCIPFEEKATILLQAWFKFFAIKHDQPENSNELFHKLLEDLKELAEYKESLENSSKEIATSNSNEEKEEPQQDSDIRQLIREECCVEVCEEQKQNREDTILELVEIFRQKELLCMHDNEIKNVVEQLAERGNCIIESLQNFRVIHKSSISFKNTSKISPVHAVAPILSIKEPEYSSSMGYEHPNTTPETKSDEIIKSGVEELVPIPNECEVTLEDKRECDLPVCENSTTCDGHSDIFSDSNNDDDISSDEESFKDIEYVEASLPDPEIVSVEEENVDVYQEEEEEVDLEDVFQIQDVVLREKLLSINRLIANIESLNDNPTLDRVLNYSVSIPIFEESDNSISDNFLPEFETFCDHTEETRSEADLFLALDNSIPPGIKFFADDSEGDIRFLEELLIDDSIPFPNNESPDSNFEDNPSIPRPPPEPPDAELDFKADSEEEIPVVINDKDEFDDNYCSFMFVKVFSFLLFAESEDTIFDPGISV